MGIDTEEFSLKRRRTKIVATVGPSSSSPEMIRKLISAGVDIFRLNMSHGDHATHAATHAIIRAAATESERPVGILVDLCGPKIRVGEFADGSIELGSGTEVTVTTRECVGGPGLIPSSYPALIDDLECGDRVLLDDGKLELRVESKSGEEARCRVIQGGILKNRKGMNLPGVKVSAPSLTEKDRADAHFALELGIDYLALSFVRRPKDVHDLREIVMASSQSSTGIIAKIEKPEALAAIDGIIEASDAIMVARGDLGVELDPQVVPVAQDQLVDLARASCKPVIVATQMLESMIDNARPTRAEVSDVAHAVSRGADAVMLSAETAAGQHPLASVQMMDAVARSSEGYLWRIGDLGGAAADDDQDASSPDTLAKAIARATAHLARDLEVRAILVISTSGRTAKIMAAARPSAPLLAVTANELTCRQMMLLWGAVPRVVARDDLDDPDRLARDMARKFELAEKGQHLLVVRGFAADPAMHAPTIGVVRV